MGRQGEGLGETRGTKGSQGVTREGKVVLVLGKI
jgi:hypothetical protein